MTATTTTWRDGRRARKAAVGLRAPAAGGRSDAEAATAHQRAAGRRSPLPAPGQAAAPAPGRQRTAWLLIGVVVVLNLVGLVMVMSSSSVESIRQYGSPWHYFERDLLWMLIGSGVFVAGYKIDHRRWRRWGRPAMIVSCVLLLAVLVPHVGVSVSGASRWLGTRSLQIQPSEFAKLALIFFVADLLDRRADRSRWRHQIGPVVIAALLLIALIMKQPDMGTSMVIAVIAMAMLFAAGAPLKALGTMFGAGVAGGFLMAVAAPYRWARMTSFLHPMRHATNTGYQAVQALVSMGSGGLLGSGLGASIASWGYLPNQQTDFIFAVIAEETGLIGSLVVVGLFSALALVGVRITCRAKERYGSLLAAGITALLIGQAVINIGAVVGLLPVTGVPLPFVSYGGSSEVFSLFGAGVLANIALGA